MAFELPPLPYGFDALEPHIDAQTMQIHHDKHHGAYVTNLNKALEGKPEAGWSIEQILQGKAPHDALVYVPRICGICSVSQSVASARAGRILRRRRASPLRRRRGVAVQHADFTSGRAVGRGDRYDAGGL